VRAGIAHVHLGTGGFVLRETGPDPVAVTGLLAGIARADSGVPRRYLSEGTIPAAGSALDRLRDLGLLRAPEDVDAACAASTRPALVVPAWGGLGAPWWSPRAGAAVLEWGEGSTREDVVAGTVRGIAFLAADIVDAMIAGGLPVAELELSGSVARSRAVARAVADATGVPVAVRDDPEASIAGVASALARATGGVAPGRTRAPAERFEPAEDLTSARAAFGEARELVMRLASHT
jgi:glycerol kinase